MSANIRTTRGSNKIIITCIIENLDIELGPYPFNISDIIDPAFNIHNVMSKFKDDLKPFKIRNRHKVINNFVSVINSVKTK